MPKVISFANQKGGVGKTSLLVQTAFYLERERKKVLVIDLDGQGNCSQSIAPKIKDSESGEISSDFDKSATRSVELFDKNIEHLNPMVCSPYINLLYAETNDVKLYAKETYNEDESAYPAFHINKIKDDYDYILIDCPPNLGQKIIAACLMSSHVVMPIKLSGYALSGVTGLIHTIYSINRLKQESGGSIKIVGFIVNDMDKSVTHKRSLEELKKAVGDMVFENIIMHRTPLDTASSEGIPVWSLGYGHVASKEVINVIEELLMKVG